MQLHTMQCNEAKLMCRQSLMTTLLREKILATGVRDPHTFPHLSETRMALCPGVGGKH
jgi:hypothetical protein